MADKNFGVKELNLIGASGTPTIDSPNNLNINAVNVAISTSLTVGQTISASGIDISGIVTATSFDGALVDKNFTGIVTATGFKTNSVVGDGSDVAFAFKYYITANGSSAYRFAGPGILNTTDNPTLRFHRGFTYILENSTGSSHPFELRTSQGGSAYAPGGNFLTGSTTGTQILTVPFAAPNTLYYQCTLHSGMVGIINIVN